MPTSLWLHNNIVNFLLTCKFLCGKYKEAIFPTKQVLTLSDYYDYFVKENLLLYISK